MLSVGECGRHLVLTGMCEVMLVPSVIWKYIVHEWQFAVTHSECIWSLENEQVLHLSDVCFTLFLHGERQQLDLFVVSFDYVLILLLKKLK